MKILNLRRAVFSSVCLLIGAVVGRFVNSLTVMIILPSVLAIGGFLFSLITKRFLCFLLLTAMALGISAAEIDSACFSPVNYQGEAVVTGRVTEQTENGRTVIKDIAFDGKGVRGKATVILNKRCEVGERLEALCDVETLRVDFGDAYSVSRFTDRVYYKLTVKDNLRIRPGTVSLSERARLKMLSAIDRYCGRSEAGILKSLLFGYRSELDKADKEAIDGIGLSHIFAVSGLHIGFIALIIEKILRRLKVKPIFALAVTVLFLAFYGSMTGFTSGVKRASIMLIIRYGAFFFRRKSDSITDLSLSAAIIVLTNPREVFDVGFIMSFAAVAGIVCFAAPISRALRKRVKNKPALYFLETGLLTVSANAFVMPVTVNTFGYFSPYTLIANMLVLPIVSVTFPIAVIIAMLTLIWSRLGVCYVAVGYAIDLIRQISVAISSLPYSKIAVAHMGAATFSYIMTLITASKYVLLKKRYKYTVMGIFSISMLLTVLI